MSEETQVETEVEVEFASPVLDRERGAREVLVRSPFLENLIREGHVRVLREIPSAAQARLERNPETIAAVQRAEAADEVVVEVAGDEPEPLPAPPARKRGGRGEG